MTATIVFVVVLIVLSAMALAFTGPLQDFFIFRPSKLKQNFEFPFPGEWKELWMEQPHLGRIHGIHFEAATASKGLVFYCHGNAGNLSSWGHLAEYFTDQGWDVFIWDYRGFGKSRGIRNQHTLYADTYAWYLQFADQYSEDRIIIYGRSMGAAMAIELASRVKARALVLETAFSSMEDLFYSYYPFAPRIFKFKYVLPSRSFLPRVECKVTFFHGTRDFVIPFRNAKKLQAGLKQQDVFIAISGAGHHDIGSYPIYQATMRDLLRE